MSDPGIERQALFDDYPRTQKKKTRALCSAVALATTTPTRQPLYVLIIDSDKKSDSPFHANLEGMGYLMVFPGLPKKAWNTKLILSLLYLRKTTAPLSLSGDNNKRQLSLSKLGISNAPES